jgi:hypothetical protein
MKFVAIFLTSSALAQIALLLNLGGMKQLIRRPVVGKCTPLNRYPIVQAHTSTEIGLKFYSEDDCEGEIVATVTGDNLNPKGRLIIARSAMTVSRDELNNEGARYYSSQGIY